jgi:hypothetical protein
MRTRRNVVTGIAAAALALTAGGIAVGSSGGTPTGHAAASAGQAPASTWVTQQGDIAQVKRHIAWTAGDPAVAQRPRSDPPGGTDQRTVPRSSGMSCCTPGSSPGAGKRLRGAGRGAAGGDPPRAGPRPRAAASQVHGFSMARCPARLASRARVRPASTTIRRSW